MSKANHISNTRQFAGRASKLLREMRNLLEEYNLMEYKPDGDDPVTDEDLSGEDKTISAEKFHTAMAAIGGVNAAITDDVRKAIFGIAINVEP